jgi:S-formylglutathione hydrolase
MPLGWSHLAIGGKPADVFTPDSPRFVLLYLHDFDGTSPAANATFTALLQQHHLSCVAPLCGPCWWVDRVCPAFDTDHTPERHLLEHVIPWMEANLPRGIAVAGIGMGGQGAVRLAFRHPDRFRVAASLDGAFDFHEWYGRGTALDEMYASRERARQDTAILHIDPYRYPPHLWFACDPQSEWFRGNDRLDEKLTAYGIAHTAVLDSVGTSDAMLIAMLEYVAGGLERESRRLM